MNLRRNLLVVYTIAIFFGGGFLLIAMSVIMHMNPEIAAYLQDIAKAFYSIIIIENFEGCKDFRSTECNLNEISERLVLPPIFLFSVIFVTYCALRLEDSLSKSFWADYFVKSSRFYRIALPAVGISLLLVGLTSLRKHEGPGRRGFVPREEHIGDFIVLSNLVLIWLGGLCLWLYLINRKHWRL